MIRNGFNNSSTDRRIKGTIDRKTALEIDEVFRSILPLTRRSTEKLLNSFLKYKVNVLFGILIICHLYKSVRYNRHMVCSSAIAPDGIY